MSHVRWQRGNGLSCVRRPPPEGVPDPFFDARCYSDFLWPAIFARWELDPLYETFSEVYARMHEEIEAGRVVLPDIPTPGYRVLGPLSEFDFEAGQPGPAMRKWQSIHFPFRTAEDLGLTERREVNQPNLPGQMPFVMASGTWWSHMMIVHQPPREP